MTRRPCVAGQFYPGDPEELEKTLAACMGERAGKPERAVAVIAPHAGYMYSGAVAGALYASVEMPDDVLLIGPNHTGMGNNAAVWPSGDWETPLGAARVNERLAALIVSESRLFKADRTAHLAEHSLEVQLPFILKANPNASIVPITIMRATIDECAQMGTAVANAVTAYRSRVLIVVSSDMNHYEDDKRTRKKDKMALDMVERLDPNGLLNVASKEDISMCGVLPTAIAITAAKALNATKARVVKYATSGETSGDYDRVVGYAGVIIN